MTGYGRGTAEVQGLRMTVEIRAVNHRYADVRFRLPGEMGRLEPVFRRAVGERVRRGRVEVALRVETAEGRSEQRFNRALFDEALAAWREAAGETGSDGAPDLGALLRIHGMFRAESLERTWDASCDEAAGRALDAGLRGLDDDRQREGEGLRRDLLARVERLRGGVARARERVATIPQRLAERLADRLEQLAPQIELDPARVAQEAALLAERADVSEELVRLDGHLEQATTLLSRADRSGPPVGKRLDFLVQEIHREINTVGSKSQDLELTRITLDLKSENERVREQVQNLE